MSISSKIIGLILCKCFARRGALRLRRHQYALAAECFSKCISFRANDWTFYSNRAVAFFALGQIENAQRDCTALIEKWQEKLRTHSQISPVFKSTAAWAYYRRGEHHLRRGRGELAIADSTQAIRLDPDMVQAYWLRGDAYIDVGSPDRAVAELTQAVNRDPTMAEAYSSRALAYLLMGEPRQALVDCNAALRLKPDLSQTFCWRGKALLDIGDYDAAIADCTEAITQDPSFAVAYFQRSLAYRRKGEHGQADADFEKAVRVDDENALRELDG